MINRKLSVRIFYRIYSSYKYVKRIIVVLSLKLRGLRIGKNSIIGDLDIQLPEQVEIGSNCNIEDNVRLRTGGPWKQSSIYIGDNTFIGHSTQINVGSKFIIGKNCMVAPLCVFSDAHHSFVDIEIPINAQNCIYTPIMIMDNVWIGSGAIILGGVTIGKGSVIAAGALVNKSVGDYEIWGGIPAKKIKSRK